MLPTSFQTLRALRVLNIGAVGLALAGAVNAVVWTGPPAARLVPLSAQRNL